MALIFADSGDHTDAVVADGKWSAERNGDFDPNSFAGQGRFSTNPVFHGNGRWLYLDLGATYQEMICGAAIKFAGGANGGSEEHVISFVDGATHQIGWSYDFAAGVLRTRRNGTQLGSDIPITFATTSFVYIEFRAKIDNSAGEWELVIDGTPVGSGSSVDTQASGNAYANRLWLGSRNDNFFGVIWDDLYLLEVDSATGAVSFLSDVRVEAKFANANGTTSDLVGSDADSTDNYLLVDDNPPDGDSTYVESGDVTDLDTYNYPSITPTAGDVFGVQILPHAKRTDSAARQLRTVALLGATTEFGPARSLGTSYSYLRDIRELDPDGNPWSISNVNAAEFGVEVFS